MQIYATLFGVLAAFAACFTDPYVHPAISKAGRVLAVLFGVLFVLTEGIALVV